jgi:phosphatidylglycerol:prolipoprotein diacylglycerol transferase
MHPTLFHLGPITVQSYGFMMMIGFLVAIHLASRRAARSGANSDFVVNLGLISLISGILGSRIFYIAHHLPQFMGAPNPLLSMINLTAGGLEFYGGFLTAVAMVIIYTAMKKRSLRWYLDILAPSIMIGLAFGRIGCFLNGCCWGATTTLPIAVQFPYGSLAFEQQWLKTHEVKVPGELIMQTPGGVPILIDRNYINMTDAELDAKLEKLAKGDQKTSEAYMLKMLKSHLEKYDTTMEGLRKLVKDLDLKSKPVHPTQLYSSLNAFLIAWLLSWYYWRRKRDGAVITLLFIIYPISRFLLESIRADNPIDTFGSFTISQGISLVSVPIAILVFIILHFMPAKSKQALAELSAEKSEMKTARPVEG